MIQDGTWPVQDLVDFLLLRQDPVAVTDHVLNMHRSNSPLRLLNIIQEVLGFCFAHMQCEHIQQLDAYRT